MKRIPICLFIILFAAIQSGIHAQSQLTEHILQLDDPANAAKAQIDDFAWMAGRWEGNGFGGMVEESWNPPMGGTMVGTFRLVKEEKPNFYEFLTLVPEGESIVYKVKHFHPNLTGWEEKEETVDFPLVKIGHNAAYFSGLTIVRNGDQLTHYLSLKQKDGTHEEITLTYTQRTMPVSVAEETFRNVFPQQTKVPIMVLGSYHMSNPGADMFNLKADDVTSPTRQREIRAIVTQLALWQPTKVAVEAPYQDSITIARYQAYLRGEHELGKSEKEQIGFRLAKKLGHSTIYPIDVRMNMNDESIGELVGKNPEKYGRYLASLQSMGEGAMAIMGEWLSKGTIGSMLYNMNDPNLNDMSHALYFQSFVPIVQDDNYAGADMVNTWYQRNLRIFSNLHQINDRPDDRIFIIYGQGHKPLIEQFAKDSPYFRADNVQDYLKGL